MKQNSSRVPEGSTRHCCHLVVHIGNARFRGGAAAVAAPASRWRRLLLSFVSLTSGGADSSVIYVIYIMMVTYYDTVGGPVFLEPIRTGMPHLVCSLGDSRNGFILD